jgi:glyoxylase-like metal-dependent hydrolase (beta-lactamase superfamily II)
MQIETLDLEFRGRRHAIASYLLSNGHGPVLVEAGPGSTLATLVACLAERGLEPRDVRHVLVTHIHLDHAGSAGWWSRQGATVWVHEVGAPHLIDPSKLISSATRIYGDQMGPLWGEILPAEAERVRPIGDGAHIAVEGLEIEAVATPGHASHHHAYRLGDVVFSGDAGGIRLPGSAWCDLPAPPPEFDREVWKSTLERLRSLAPARLYPTHFGGVDGVEEQLDDLESQLDEGVAFVEKAMAGGLRRDEIVERYEVWCRERATAAGLGEEDLVRLEVANPRPMSVDGIARYLRKRSGL